MSLCAWQFGRVYFVPKERHKCDGSRCPSAYRRHVPARAMEAAHRTLLECVATRDHLRASLRLAYISFATRELEWLSQVQVHASQLACVSWG